MCWLFYCECCGYYLLFCSFRNGSGGCPIGL